MDTAAGMWLFPGPRWNPLECSQLAKRPGLYTYWPCGFLDPALTATPPDALTHCKAGWVVWEAPWPYLTGYVVAWHM